MNRIYPVLFTCLFSLLSYGQFLVNDVVGQSGEEISNPDITINHTSGELVCTTINNTQITLTQGFQQTAQMLYMSPKAILQGASIGTSDGLMRDDLRTGNYLPDTSPYDAEIIEANGAFSVSGNDAIVDWVIVKLRNTDTKVISEKSALIQRDGDIVNLDGVSPLQFMAQNKDYYVEVNHRNHLGAMTKNPITLSSTPTVLDFTNGSVPMYGNNSLAEIDVSTYALWAGNTNSDKIVRYLGPNNDSNTIKDAVLGHPGNSTSSNFFPYTGYDNSDINMNGIIRYLGPSNDTNILKDIILSHPGNTVQSNFFPIIEQTPN